MADHDPGFVQSSIDETKAAASTIGRVMYEGGLIDGVPHGAIDFGSSIPTRIHDLAAMVKHRALGDIERANPHELLAERHVTAEYSQLRQADFASGAKLPDGAIRVFSPKDDPLQPAGRPEFGQNTNVFFVNGINTSAEQASAEGAMLAGRLHQNVSLVYVQTTGIQNDVAAAFKETIDPVAGRMNPPEKNLSRAIEESLDRGENVHIAAYSRGALVTQLALDNVRDHYLKQGHDGAWVDEHINPHISVETFNGASHRMPPGVSAEHYVSKGDYLVGNTIGMGAPAPVIRELAAQSIDASLAFINNMPPDQRAAVATDLARIRGDIGAIDKALDPAYPNAPVIGATPALDNLNDLRRDVQALSRDSRMPAPVEDELNRQGHANQPNGPVHGVPVYIDEPDLKGNRLGDWAVEQHDLPGMLPSRHGHTTELKEIAGNASPAVKVHVDRAIPAEGGRGGALPPASSISVWDGRPQSGTVFEVDSKTSAMHTGRGEFVVIDNNRFAQGQPPPSGSYIDLSANGHVVVEQQRGIQPPQHGR